MIDGGVRLNDDLLNNVVCDSEKTTCFVDGESVVTSSLLKNTTINDYDLKFQGIKDFLGKPYLLGSILWGSSSGANSNLFYTDIGPLLTTVVPWEIKTRGFELIRGTFNIRVQINADPFQQGRALLHYIPNYATRFLLDPYFSKRTNYNLMMKFQHPHLELDCHDTASIMSIPYVSPSPYYDRKEQTYDWGRVYLDVVAPIESGAAAGNKNAEITIFGYWTDVDLAAPIVPQGRSYSARKGKDLEKKEETLKISQGLSIVSSVASSLSAIPMINPIMTTVAWISRTASEVASAYGWSKPRVNTAPVIMAQQTYRYVGTSDGPDISVPTSLIHDNQIAMTNEYSITDEDEMSLKFLLKIPTYMGYITWTTGSTSNTQLYTAALSPQSLSVPIIDGPVLGHTATAASGAPLYYLSNFFNYYRGSINVHLKFVKTIFHSGKLLITFTPVNLPTTAPDVSTSIYSLREVVDIREQSEITLNLPYMLHRPYLDPDQAMGTLRVMVLNDLRCPETCAQDVQMLIFYTAGDDFEFQVPTCSTNCGTSIYTPQSRSYTETIVNTGIGDSGVKETSTMYSSKSIGEHFLSIKQLLNRNTQLQPRVADAWTGTSYTIYPWFVVGSQLNPTTGALSAENYAADAFSWLAPMYTYFRGKARVLLLSGGIGNGVTTHANTTNFFKKTTNYGYKVDTSATNPIGRNVLVTDNPGVEKQPFQTPVPSGAMMSTIFQHVPYYCKFPVSFVNVWQGFGNTGVNLFLSDETIPTSAAQFTNASTFGGNTTFQRSFSDDFQLCFFLNCPPVLTNYV